MDEQHTRSGCGIQLPQDGGRWRVSRSRVNGRSRFIAQLRDVRTGFDPIFGHAHCYLSELLESFESLEEPSESDE